jgi:hypothetical protein
MKSLFAQRLLNIIMGVITLIIVPLTLTPIEQGYYYLVFSLIALQVFFEMGLNFVLAQVAGHEFAHLKINSAGELKGNKKNIERFVNLWNKTNLIYLAIAIAFFLIALPVGWHFFSIKGDFQDNQWANQWITIVFLNALMIYASPKLSILESIGYLHKVAQLRFYTSTIGFPFVWIALYLKMGLWSIAVLMLIQNIMTYTWLFAYAPYKWKLNKKNIIISSDQIAWKTEILPMQWKVAIGSISGYLIFQAFTPIILLNRGSIEAGRVGLALNIFNSLTTLGMTFVNANTPMMLRHIAFKNRELLNSIFIKSVKYGLAFTIFSCLGILILVWYLNSAEIAIASRISELKVLLCLAIVTIVNILIFSAAAYMRAHKVEPMLIPTILGGFLTLSAVYFGSLIDSVTPFVLYAASTLFIGLPWTWFLFKRYYYFSKIY